MSSSDFTQRRRQERQVQAAARAEEERAETAEQMLDRLLEEMDTPGQEHGERTGTRSSDSTRRSLTEKEVGESVMALTGAGGSGALVQVAAVRAGAGERIAQNPAVAEEVARPVSLPPEEPPGLEVVRGNGNGGLLSGLTPGVNSLTLSGVPMTQTPVVARMSEGFREPPVVGNREEGQSGKHQSSTEVGGGAAAVVGTVALLERPGCSPVESPEDARVKQLVPSAPTGPPVIYQPAGAPVGYTATGGAQGFASSWDVPAIHVCWSATYGNGASVGNGGCGSGDGNRGHGCRRNEPMECCQASGSFNEQSTNSREGADLSHSVARPD